MWQWVRLPRDRAQAYMQGEVDGQAQPARDACCPFEHCPLLAGGPQESILLAGTWAGVYCPYKQGYEGGSLPLVSVRGLGGCIGVLRQTGD